MVFISKVNNYMFRLKAAIFRLSQLQFCSKQNCDCDNLKMTTLGRNM